MLSRPVPIHLELPTVKINPLEQEAQRSIRKLADDFSRHNVDDDFGAFAPSMNVRWIVFTVVHEHDDTIEATDDGHSCDDLLEVHIIVAKRPGR